MTTPARRCTAGSLWAVAVIAASAAVAAPPPPELHGPAHDARAGYYQLEWEWTGEGPVTFHLQEGDGAEFAEPETLYRGADRSRAISGRDDGVYHYRVRAEPPDAPPSDWSEPLAVTVRHHPVGRAVTFLAVGGLVFLATAALVLGGALRARDQEDAP